MDDDGDRGRGCLKGCLLASGVSGLGLLVVMATVISTFDGCEFKPRPDDFSAADCGVSESPLIRDAATDDLVGVRSALDRGVSASRPDSNGLTPIGCAFESGSSPEMVALLLDHGSGFGRIEDPMAKALVDPDDHSWFSTSTALKSSHTSTRRRAVELLEIVLDHGVKADDSESSALVTAASTSGQCGNPPTPEAIDAAVILVDHGADPTQALGPAVSAGSVELVNQLLIRGADANGGTPSPLVRAAYCGRNELVLRLLAAHADPNRPSMVNPFTLVLAFEDLTDGSPATSTQPTLVGAPITIDPIEAAETEVLSKGFTDANDAGANGGVTPLLAAVATGKARTAALLMDAGADPDTGVASVRPIDVAVLRDDAAACLVLRAHGADIVSPAGPLPGPVELALRYNRPQALAAVMAR